jgi:hypothetical protein
MEEEVEKAINTVVLAGKEEVQIISYVNIPLPGDHQSHDLTFKNRVSGSQRPSKGLSVGVSKQGSNVPNDLWNI